MQFNGDPDTYGRTSDAADYAPDREETGVP
jgi:hypothetical protein